MKNRNLLKILFLIFFVFLLAAFYPSIRDISTKYLPQKEVGPVRFDTFTKDSTSKITLGSGNDAVILSGSGDKWNVASYSASASRITELFDAFKNTSVERVVSTNPENQSGYGVASDSGILVSVSRDGQAESFIVGNFGPETGSFYFRVPGDSKTYIATGGLKDALTTDISGWRDKTITEIGSGKAVKIEVRGKDNFALAKNKDNKWEITSGGKKKILDEDTSSLPVSQLLNLTAMDFGTAADRKKFDSATDTDIITVFDDKNNDLATLTILKGEDKWLVTVSGKEDLFTVSASALSDFFELPEK